MTPWDRSARSRRSSSDVCGKSDIEGCASADNHIAQIRGDQPAWLPKVCGHRLRAVIPALQLPPEGEMSARKRTSARLSIRLGQAHHQSEGERGRSDAAN
jgi:hypothetical protein